VPAVAVLGSGLADLDLALTDAAAQDGLGAGGGTVHDDAVGEAERAAVPRAHHAGVAALADRLALAERAGLVGATAFTGAVMNVATGDQYISILITADMFRDAYRGKGLESRLLSRTIEDSGTLQMASVAR
jgi:hypothetical protein